MLSLFEPTETETAPTPRIGEYDAERARKRAQEGIDRAELGSMAHIGDDWPLRAFRAVKATAEAHPTFIVDAVWQHLGEEPKEPRAMGAIMRRAVAERLIEATGQYQASARVTAHSNPRRVWKSLVYKGGGE